VAVAVVAAAIVATVGELTPQAARRALSRVALGPLIVADPKALSLP
jgi:hypothetical protein